MPLVVMDADEICMICGKLIRKAFLNYPESFRNKRRIAWNSYCAECKIRVDEEMSALGLTEGLFKDYAMSKYLINKGIPERVDNCPSEISTIVFKTEIILTTKIFYESELHK